MDINDFITQLEIECGCPGEGYIKCLDAVKELKAENKIFIKGKGIDCLKCVQDLEKIMNGKNKDLKKEIKKLKDDKDTWELDAIAHCAELDYHKHSAAIDDWEAFDRFLKSEYGSRPELYKKLYEYYDMEEMLAEEDVD